MTGEEMKAARDRMGLSQSQLARELDMVVSSISKMERGDSRIRRVVHLALEALENRKA